MQPFQTTSGRDVPLTSGCSSKKRSLLQGLLALALLLMVSAAGISFFSPTIRGMLPRLASNLANSISPVTTICHGPDTDPAHGHYVVATTVTGIVQPGDNVISKDNPVGTLTMMLEYCPRYNSFFTRLSFQAEPGMVTFWPLTDCLLEERSSGYASGAYSSAHCYNGTLDRDGRLNALIKTDTIMDSPVRADTAQDGFWHACWIDASNYPGTSNEFGVPTHYQVCTPWMHHTGNQQNGQPNFQQASEQDGGGQCGSGRSLQNATDKIFYCKETYTGVLPH